MFSSKEEKEVFQELRNCVSHEDALRYLQEYLDDHDNVAEAHLSRKDRISICLKVACLTGDGDTLDILFDNYKANVNDYILESTDVQNAKGDVKINLAEQVLRKYREQEHLQSQPLYRLQYIGIITKLITRGIDICPNANPLVGAIAQAYLVANPDEFLDTSSPYYASQEHVENPHLPWIEPYSFFKSEFPDKVESFKEALEKSKTTLRAQMNAAANENEPTGDTFRSIGDILPPAPTGPKPPENN